LDLLVESRSALLDALEALREHQASVIVIGAQAIYLHTGGADVALAEATKDSDLALDARTIGEEPLLQQAMAEAGFIPDPAKGQPGAWLSPRGIPVDLMVPEAIAGGSGSRSVEMPPHDKRSARRAVGLEAAVVDHSEMDVPSLHPADPRVLRANVAGPGALLVAKLHKLGERQGSVDRLVDKDAHDVYRLLRAIPTADLAPALNCLSSDAFAGAVTAQGVIYLRDLFAAGSTALGSVMAGRAEQGLGDPDFVSASVSALAGDLLDALGA
jgi:hypothetical protein